LDLLGESLDYFVTNLRIKSGVFGDLRHEFVIIFGFLVKTGHSAEFRDKINWFVFFISGNNKRLSGIFDFDCVVLLIIVNETHLETFNSTSWRLSKIHISDSVDTMISI
jgi:hypothetical protein